MDTLISIFIFLLGTIVGSFLNVVIFRFNTNKKITKGRSVCFSCSKTLYWYELIPVLSFMFQKGRCRGCASRISHQYPLVEVVTGFVFLLLALKFMPLLAISNSIFVFALSYFVLVFCILIVIGVYDIKHKIIPDTLVYFFIALSFLINFLDISVFGITFVWPTISQLIAGPLLALPFALIWFLSRGRMMGFGDAKLILGIGWLLGLSAGLVSLILSFWVGAGFSLLILMFSKLKVNLKTEIPLAPFLILGTFFVFIYDWTLVFLANLFTM